MNMFNYLFESDFFEKKVIKGLFIFFFKGLQ